MKHTFIHGLPVTQTDFCSRPELATMQKSIAAGKSVYLVGRQKMGKTSMVLNLNLANHFLVNVDFKQVHRKEDILKTVVTAILQADQFQQGSNPDFTALFQKFNQYGPNVGYLNNQMQFTINPQGELKVAEVLALLQPLNGKNPILFLDNIQQIYKVHKDLANQLVTAALKHLTIFSEAGDMFQSGVKFVNLVNKTTYIELQALAPQDYQSFAQKIFTEQQKELSEAVFTAGLELAGELSNDRQMFFKTLLEADQTVYQAYHLEQAMRLVVDQYSDLYEVIWEDLTINQQNTLQQLAKDPEVRVYSKQFCEELNIQNTNTVIKIIQSLMKKKLVYKQGPSHQLFSPFFRYWLNHR
jgi:hypothetical protein